ncbi:MAG: hypothetical protein LJF06_16675 [Gemmatimonadetes bacterium]|nr:hypothetical protein [Gemmatimonadota bacterium]
MDRLRIRRFVDELRRRRVFRVLLVYLAVSYGLAQVADLLMPALELPSWTVTFVVVLLLLGLPITVVLAWAFDITPEGIERTLPLSGEIPTVEGAQRAAAIAAPPAAPPDNTSPARPAAVVEQGVERASDSSGSGPTQLMVLPFRMLKEDPETEFLASSLPDAITCSLAGLRSLVVRSSIAGTRFAGGTPDLSSIADRGVDAVLMGTLLRIGTQLRLTVQLAHVPDGTMLWSEVTVVDLGDLFALQDELTRRVLDSLSVSLSASERMQLRRDAPGSAHAYELFLRANHLSHQTGRWDEARQLYLQSLHIDAAYAPAWAYLGRCYRLIAKWSPDASVHEAMQAEAEASFQHAFELNPDLPVGHRFFAQLEVELGRAPSSMVRLIQSLRHSDADPDLFAGLVHSCRFAGLLRESASAHLRARRLDGSIPTTAGHTFFMLGRYDGAASEAWGDIGYLAPIALTMIGRKADAIRVLREGETRAAATTARHHLASLQAILTGDSRRALSEAIDSLEIVRDPEGRFYAARHIAHLGEGEKALEIIRGVLEMGYCCAHQLQHDPWLASVRAEPGFAEAAERADAALREATAQFKAAGGPEVVGPVAVAA